MPPKRKRTSASADGTRPSPHRPHDTNIGQYQHDRDDGSSRGRGRNQRNMNRRDSSQGGHGRGGANGSPAPKRRPSGSHQQSQQQQQQQQQQEAMPPPSPVIQKAPSQPSTSRPPTPSTAQKTPTPLTPPKSIYHYQHLTDDKLRGWAERGRREIVELGRRARESNDLTELSGLYQEIIQAVIDGRMNPMQAGTCVKEVIGEGEAMDDEDADASPLSTFFLDSFSIIMDIQPDAAALPSIREFLQVANISPVALRKLLEAPVLEKLQLTSGAFGRDAVRYATKVLYRQANYNLLREETEGFSKLITQLYTNYDNNLRPEVAEETFERIKALIGAFDMDVGRVLDVTLDCAAAALVKQYKFFVKLLRVSSWWPQSQIKLAEQVYSGGLPPWATPGYPQWTTTEADEAVNARLRLERDSEFWDRAREVHLNAFFELGGRRVHDATALSNGAKETQSPSHQAWIEATGTLPPPGNRVAAQLLGFKLLFYYSDMRDAEDVLPANLLYLAALLIKIGFISIVDLYPHLSPADEGMDKVREEKTKENEKEAMKRGNGQKNALLMAGVLPQGDDDNPDLPKDVRREAAKKAEVSTAKPVEPEALPEAKKEYEQKASLCIQLLTVGALPEALFILGRFPWIPDVFPEALDRVHRILHVALDKVYNDARPATVGTTACSVKLMPHWDQSGVPKGTVKLNPLLSRKVMKWPHPDAFDTGDREPLDYHFYWEDWTDNIPVCQTVDDVITLCDTFVNVIGVRIGKDATLLQKLAKIASENLNKDTSEANLARWLVLLRRLLLPALSLTKANSSVVGLIWDIVKRYPITTRFSLYAEWFEGPTSRNTAMVEAFSQARSDTRGTMKRISLTTLPQGAKALAKTSFSSPGIVFKVALEQLESYPNLIEAFVECAKYFTELSYDVLIWSLMNALGKSRSRTQADHALTTSKWLTALSKYTGKIFRRYPLLSPDPVLHYVNDQLLQGNSTDLIILKELISSMGGIVDLADFTDYQILSMAGGEYLKRHTLISAQDKRFDNEKSSKRLLKALTDSKLATQLLVNIAQFRQAAIYNVPEEEAHIKYLSSLLDESHQILVLYLDLLWTFLGPSTFDEVVPSITDLMVSYGLDSSIAFMIGRSSLGHRMFPWKAKDTPTTIENKEKALATPTDGDGDAQMAEPKNADEETKDSPSNDDQKSDDPSQMRATLQPLIDSVRETKPAEIWGKVSPETYVAFWALQLGDLFCPEKNYKQEKERLHKEEAILAKDRTDMTRQGQERKMEKRKALMQLQIDLSEEQAEQKLRQAKWKFFLSKLFQASAPEPSPSPESVADTLLEQCFLPRVVLSPADAEYTYRFIRALHDWNAPGFKLKSLYDRLFNANRIRTLIFTCTVREAENFGRFFKLILEDLSRWHKNDPVPGDRAVKDQPRLGAYEKEGKGPSEQPRLGFALTFDEDGKPETFVEHDKFKTTLYDWHKNLNTALKVCLGGSEWMHIRNAITVLKAVLDYFPAVDFMGTLFLNQLRTITKNEAAGTTNEGEGSRVDLSVAAQGAMSELMKRKTKWMIVQAFRTGQVDTSKAETTKAAGLRATAPEFKPEPTQTDSRKGAIEEEDGEVKDGKTQATAATGTSRTLDKTRDSLPPRPSVPQREAPRREPTANVPPRASTPRSNQAQAPSGPRNTQHPQGLPERPPPQLPNRPNVPIPGHHDRHGQPPRGYERREDRDPRGPRDPRDMRDHHDSREIRETREPREHRNPRDAWTVELERTERPPSSYMDRRPQEHSWDHSRQNQQDLMSRHGPYERERGHRDSRGGRQHHDKPSDTPATPAQAPPIESQQANADRASLVHPDRGPDSDRAMRHRRPPPSTESMEGVNPARAALIEEATTGPAPTPNRPLRDDGRDRNNRHDPDRRSSRHASGNAQPEEHHGRLQPPDRAPGRNARERSPSATGHPRNDRPLDRETDRPMADRAREPSNFPRPDSRGQEQEQHRAPPAEDHSYGRLNPIQSVGTDPPSGPRGRGRGTPRGPPTGPGSFPNNRPDSRYGPPDTPQAPSDRGTPQGPSSGRGSRRPYDQGPPQTPSGPSTGMHPDRVKNFGTGPNAAPSGSGIHPDRAAHLPGTGNTQLPPPPPQYQSPGPSQGRSNAPNNMTPDRQGGNGPMVGNQPDGGFPAGPTGPSDRNRTGGRRQIAGINNMLQANSRPTPAPAPRRNQPRQMLANSDVQVLTGGPSATPPQERSDIGSSKGGSANGEDSSKKDDHEPGRRERESRSDRPSRSSRRNSRDRDRDRERSPAREKENKDRRDYREREHRSASGAIDGPREERESRRSGRNPMGPPANPPNPGGGMNNSGREGGRSHRDRGHKGGEDWGQGGGGGGGGGGRPHRGPPREPSGQDRKRRDDGTGGGGGGGGGGDKRRR